MNNFYLICKNWFKSLKKIKGAFITFIVLNFLLGIAFSIFLETNNQLNQQIENLNLNIDGAKFKNQLAILDPEKKIEQKNFYHLFCTDYFQINFNSKENDRQKIIEAKKDNHLITRRPLLTFGSKNGCFKDIDYLEVNKMIKNVDLYWSKNEKRSFFNGFDLQIKNIDKNTFFERKFDFAIEKLTKIYFPLKLNEKSVYYQNSIHGRLIKKYQKTNDTKYLTWAKKLEEHFFPRIARFIYKKIIIALSDFFSNRFVTKVNRYQNLTWKEILKEIERKKEIKETISENQNSLNVKILNLLNNDKEEILTKNNESQKQKIKELNDLIKEIEKYFKINDANKETQKNYFIESIKVIRSSEKNEAEKEVFFLELLQKSLQKKWTFLIPLLDQILLKLTSDSLFSLDETFILQNFAKIKSETLIFLKNKLKIKVYLKIKEYQKILKQYQIFEKYRTKKYTNIENIALIKLNSYIEKKTNEQNYQNIILEIDQNIENLKQDFFIEQFLLNKSLIQKLIDKTISFYQNYYFEEQYSRIKKILLQNVESLSKTEDKYNLVKQKISLIKNVFASISERLNQANKIKKQFNLKEKYFFDFQYNQHISEIEALPIISFGKKINDVPFSQIEWKEWKQIILPLNKQDLIEMNFKNFIELLENNFLTLNQESIEYIDSLFTNALEALNTIWDLLEQNIPIIAKWKTLENKFNLFSYLDFDFWKQKENITKIFVNLQNQENIEKLNFITLFQEAIQNFAFFAQPNEIITNFSQDDFFEGQDTQEIAFEAFKSKIFSTSNFAISKMIEYIYENDWEAFDKYTEKYRVWTQEIYLNLLKKIKSSIKNKNKLIEVIEEEKSLQIKIRDLFSNENIDKTRKNVLLIWKQIILILLEEKKIELEEEDRVKISKYFEFLEQKENYHQIYEKSNHYKENIWNISKILKIDEVNQATQKQYYQTLESLEKKINDLINQEVIFESNYFWYTKPKYSKIFDRFFENQTKINDHQKKEITIESLETAIQKIDQILPNEWQGKNDQFEIQNNKNWFNYLTLSILDNNLFFKKNDDNPFKEAKSERRFAQIIVENEKINLLLHKIFTNLNNFDINFILGHVINDPKNEETIFVMQQNEEIQFQIISGRKAILENEVVISPTTARNKNLKVGDKINFFNIKNFTISGIGNQKEFIFPIFALDKFVPKKNDAIFYLTKKSYFENFKVKYLIHVKKNFNIIRHSFGILNQKDEQKDQEENLKNLKLISGEDQESNLTISSFFFNKEKGYQSKNNSVFGNLQLKKIKNLLAIPFARNFDVLKIHQKYINYSTIGIIVFFALMISFVTYYTVNKKIEINRSQLGLLKAIGIKNYKIWFALSPIILIIFLINLGGWFVGIFLQLINFKTFEQLLNLHFQRYQFDFTNLLISFSIVVFVVITTVLIYEKSKFKKMNAYVLLKKINKKSKFSLNINFNFAKKKHLFKRIPKIKINVLFFKIFWKKMLFLFFIFVIIFFNILAIVKILTIQNETIEQQYKNINYAVQFKHHQPLRGVPFSYQRILLSKGFKDIDRSKFAPIEKWRSDIYFKNNDQFKKYQSPDIINEVLPTFRPIIGKTINYNWVMDLLEQASKKSDNKKNTQKFLCEIFESEVKNIQENCIDDVIENYIPILFEGENSTEIKKHFPVSSNVIKFNDQTDELFTYSEVKMKNEKKFNLFGLNDQTDVFDFKEESKKEVFDPQNNGENGEIKVISNTDFLLKHNLKVQQKMKLKYLKKEIVYQPNENIKQIINFDDWYYQKDDQSEKIPVTSLREDVKFYRKWELSESLKQKIDQNDGMYYLGQAKENETQNYFPWINIANINLNLIDDTGKEKKIKPFLPTEGELEIVPSSSEIGKPISWFARQIRDQKLKIVENWKNITNSKGQEITFKIIDNVKTYFEPRLFLEQGVLNSLIGFNKKKTYKNQYKWFNGRFSKDQNLLNTSFMINLYNDFGYSDIDVISVLSNKGRKMHIKNLQGIDFIKQLLNNFADYFFRVNFFIFVFNFLLIIFLFIWVIKLTFRYLRSIVLNLKAFGYNWKIILFQIFQTFLIPFAFAFVFGIFITNAFLKMFIEAIAQYNFYLFVSNEAWIFASVFFFLAFILLIIIRNFYQNIKKTNLSSFFKDE